MSNVAWLAENLGSGLRLPLSMGDVEALDSVAGQRLLAGGTPVFCRHTRPDEVFIVRSGTIALSEFQGGRSQTLELLGPGSVFGDIPVLIDSAEVHDALALTDSELLVISASDFVEILRTRRRLAHRWLVSLAERTVQSRRRVGDLLMGDLQTRVASFLLHDRIGAKLEISQQTMADLLGVRRQSLNTVLRRLADRGVIRLGYRSIEIVDAGDLRGRLA